MKFRVKKTENCFAGACTYEYELPVTGEELLPLLEGFAVKENHAFRRPVFSAKRGGLEVKGILAAKIIKINYTAGGWEREKREMEEWLEVQRPRVIGLAQSVCPECLKVIPAEKVWKKDGIYLEKTCPEHGSFEALIWEGSLSSYEEWGRELLPADSIPKAKEAERGCPLDCGLCSNHERKGCCVLLEITSRCNMCCPICFAKAGEGEEKGDPTLEELGEQMDYLMAHGGPFNLQLSGGEPTMREDLEELIRMGREKGFTFFQLNTNGLRLAEEPGYAAKLKRAGLSCVFLQFDSLRDSVYERLRGRRLLEIKEAAIEACEKAGLGVVLVPVLAPGVNEEEVGDIIRYAKSRMPVVRGVHFQPLSYFGRCAEKDTGYRLTIPKILALLEEQTEGELKAEHFNGGNATNPYCTFQANYIREEGMLSPLLHGKARAEDTSGQAREFVARQWSGCCSEEPKEEGCCCCGEEPKEESCCCGEEPKEEGCCCCGEEPEEESCCCCGEDTRQFQLDVSSFDEFLENLHKNTLAVSGMLFQDSYTLELERLRRCYILETDGRYGMVPFCAYNLTSREGRTLYR